MNRFRAWYQVQPAALRVLLTINVVIYVLWQVILVQINPVAGFVWGHLALNPSLPGILFEPWQLITYNFLHLRTGLWGLVHIGFNMLWLYWIGKEYEELHGRHRLLSAYLIGGFGGGLLTVLLYAVFPDVGLFGGIVHGASASVLGVMTTVAILYPYKSIGLIFIGSVRLIYVVVGFLVLDVLFMAGSNTSVSAHLGGVLFGLLLAKAEGNGVDLSSWARVFFRSSRRDRTHYSKRDESIFQRIEGWLSSRNGGKQTETRQATIHPFRSSSPDPDDDTSESEIDRILDKISEAGYEALTEKEKRTLYEASRK